jgi:hypothetical protein
MAAFQLTTEGDIDRARSAKQPFLGRLTAVGFVHGRWPHTKPRQDNQTQAKDHEGWPLGDARPLSH